MNMDLGIYQEQTQKLVMTQQMRQAIHLLQCTSEELNQYLLSEINKNPLIDYQPAPGLGEIFWSARRRQGSGKIGSVRNPSEGNPLEQVARVENTMAETLEQQILLMCEPKEYVQAAKKLLGCLDENGYLDYSDEEREKLCGGKERYLEALRIVQQCEPVGIGARNLKECLLLQAQLLENEDEAIVRRVIEYHLEDVAAGKLQSIAKSLSVSVQEVQSAVDLIRRMNPRPGANLDSSRPHYVVPEVLVQRIGGRYQVLVNEDAQPKVAINKEYATFIKHPSGDSNVVHYLNQQLQNAKWLTQSLEQRKSTLYRVAQVIVQVQQRFFAEGPAGLQPLTLHEVAAEVSLHESTVSRTVRGKFMQTPKGVFELKYFFSAELSAADGVVSSQSVKHLIRELVEQEDVCHPLSDENLCRRLLEKGIRVSRRTVAKYRDESRIPSSAKRRRFE